jgi:hypothetical protein
MVPPAWNMHAPTAIPDKPPSNAAITITEHQQIAAEFVLLCAWVAHPGHAEYLVPEIYQYRTSAWDMDLDLQAFIARRWESVPVGD